MLKLKRNNLTSLLSLTFIILILLMSCSTPRSGKYRKHRHVGSSSYYSKGSYYQNKSRRNTIPISKNYRIKNRRTSGNY